ncbi:MAG: hypothetical protein JXB88_12500 [Spirochaetales bacterium]|nr:hypothetical protein [Spirochaetales bacterium]
MKQIKILIIVMSFLLLTSVLCADTMNWIIHIMAGMKFTVHFNEKDSKYKGLLKKEPLDFLRSGESYDVIYKNGEFLCSGYHNKRKQKGTWGDSRGNPLNNQISLWGRIFAFDGEGNIYDAEHGLVGHLTR